MSQKIVITANVKREPQQSAPRVSYEWHWQRIISIFMLVVMSFTAVVYGLTSANAEQDHALHASEQQPELTILNDSHSVPVLLNGEPESTGGITLQNTVTVNNTDTINAVVFPSEPLSSEPMPTDAELTPKAPIAAPKPEQLEQNTQVITPKALSQAKNFALQAQVASVAIGAKIDTAKISRAVLTRSVNDREPSNVFAADVRLSEFEGALSFFSELINLQGQQVKHVWVFQENVMAEVVLNVSAPRFRTYSTKNIMRTQLGLWRVDVVDEQGALIAQKEFRILAD